VQKCKKLSCFCVYNKDKGQTVKAKRHPDSERLNQPDFIARLQAGDSAAYRELDKELFPYGCET
jgi:hypothetical protein